MSRGILALTIVLIDINLIHTYLIVHLLDLESHYHGREMDAVLGTRLFNR